MNKPRDFIALTARSADRTLSKGEILVVWEDDDIYLPHHISRHVTAMEGHLWSRPSKVLSDYSGQIQAEDATGRFHASSAMTRQAFEQVGGWPLTQRGDFDQQLIVKLNAVGIPGDPCSVAGPGYVFRWGSTGAYHGQAMMRGPDDENWYDNALLTSVSNDRPVSVGA